MGPMAWAKKNSTVSMSETAIFKISPFSLSIRQAGASFRIVSYSCTRILAKSRYAPAWETTPSVYRPRTISRADSAVSPPYSQGEPPTIPAPDNSSNAPKPISPIWERFPMMLASVETNNVPFTGAAMCSSRLVMAGIE